MTTDLTTDDTDEIDGPDKVPAWTRRGLIAGVAAAGAGAAAGLVLGASPAGALDGNPVVLGEPNSAADSTTVSTTVGNGLWGQTTSAVAGWAGVEGDDKSASGGFGVLGTSQHGIAVYGINPEPSGLLGTQSAAVVGDSGANIGVLGLSSVGNGVTGTTTAAGNSGVWGNDESTGGAYGVVGQSMAGDGVVGQSQAGYGVSAKGGLAPLYLAPASSSGSPTEGEHLVGELYTDSNGALFSCTASGTSGTWVRVAAGPSAYAQGAFCLLGNPIRLFDSRQADPPAATSRATGPIAATKTQTLQVTGIMVGGVEVPLGAVAVIGNVTAVDATSRGYLTCYPEGVATPATSSLNFPASTAVANGVTVALSASGQMEIYVSETTDVVFDATGFVA